MIKILQTYQTTDGELFLDQSEAEQHEKDTFQAWLDSGPLIDICEIIDSADPGDNKWCSSEKDVAMDVARKAFQLWRSK